MRALIHMLAVKPWNQFMRDKDGCQWKNTVKITQKVATSMIANLCEIFQSYEENNFCVISMYYHHVQAVM